MALGTVRAPVYLHVSSKKRTQTKQTTILFARYGRTNLEAEKNAEETPSETDTHFTCFTRSLV